ncbi:ammonium transporter [Corynebacterium phocae]|uniref:Ammonium transporter n=1 Tax=Corynebacterium phocae TaxID=161895 RepID=A0A1L7D2I1_9CORY|nr:ammonium transporter [Corynebacterium phocae]APT92191.1 ammonium transporter [Corynebacterium phocae]KAA8725769.1 ammonium transporter [Corynebacterium phocae]
MESTATGAWLLVSSSFVLLMTPALAFFYGGMSRVKAVLNMLMMCYAALAIVPIVHVFWGFNLAYGKDSFLGFFANPFSGQDYLHTLDTPSSSGYPLIFDVIFQMTFAVIACAIIAGSIAERTRFTAWLLFIPAWVTLVYYPLAHMVWGGGLLSHSANSISGFLFGHEGGHAHVAPIDFAGGTVVHISAGTAALVLALMVGPRRGFKKQVHRPHNLPMVMLGTGLLWFGWCGFNAGSALSAGGLAALAWLNTAVAAAAGGIGWLAYERYRDGYATPLGLASGLVAGLVAITPAAGALTPTTSVILGFSAGLLSSSLVSLKYKLAFDDTLDVVAVHLAAGVWGTLAVGVLASNRSWQLVCIQTVVALAAMAFSGALTWAIAKAIDKTVGLRLDPETEHNGADKIHGESAYDWGTSPFSRF